MDLKIRNIPRLIGLSLIGIYIIVILYEFILISLEKGIFGALGPTFLLVYH